MFAAVPVRPTTRPPRRPRSTLLSLLLPWFVFYASFTLFRPALLDDADSVHVEVAREMLLRHDFVTLYANGIRYLEKAPLLYWSMAFSMRLAGLLGAHRPEVLAAAARVPLALAVLALAFCCEGLARRLFHSARAGLYAGLILLSSFGFFIFTRITIPDALVCLWITGSLFCFWCTEELGGTPQQSAERSRLRLFCWGFAVGCALNVLTKGLIGVVFPVSIVLAYLLLTRGFRRTLRRLRELCPASSLIMFFLIAAPWHILAGLANPTQGHPAPFVFLRDTASALPWGHWQVPLPSDGNVRGWWWFYFMNEHVLRYLNLRVPHDYDTVPLWIFWGLCLIWLMPWSAFAFKAASWAVPLRSEKWRGQLRRHDLPLRQRGLLLLAVWAGFVLLFFSLSTRQEYYVLPGLPALAMLLGGWLARDHSAAADPQNAAPALKAPGLKASALRAPELKASGSKAWTRCVLVLLGFGTLFACASLFILLRIPAPAPGIDLASQLAQNPGEYAMSFGHILDFRRPGALSFFRLPLFLAMLGLFGGPLCALVLRRGRRTHAANLALAAGAFAFLLAADLGLQTFAPVLTSAQLAEAIRPQLRPQDIVAIHGEYESGSTLGFYLQRNDIHILEGRSSNLWYGSFFPDAPPIFETPESLAAKWNGVQRIFLWQSLTDPPNTLPVLHGPVYVLVKSGGKEIVSNRPGI
ncbi:MAG: ArnT family glycosyltransferase [Janthinobacterium lividum]